MTTRFRSLCLPAAVLAVILACGSIGVSARQTSPVAWLSSVLADLLQLRPLDLHRVIVSGNVTAVREAAARHGVSVVRVLDRHVVVMATAVQVAALQLEPAINALNPDMTIAPSMAVADKTVGADQTRAGMSGTLLTAGLPGVTGRSVGVAIVDSGIASHERCQTKWSRP
jgi:hypothetical protein